MQRESVLEQYFARKIKGLGGRTFKIAPTTAGLPDRMVLMPAGLIFLVELKTEVGRLSEIQKHWHAEIGRLGTTVYTLYGREQVDNWLRDIMEKSFVEYEIREQIRKKLLAESTSALERSVV